MPHPPRATLRELLHTLPNAPSAKQFDAAVAALVADAVLAAHPLMSLGATLRHRAARLPNDLQRRLRDAAQGVLLGRRRGDPAAEPTPPLGGQWLTVREAALALGITEGTLHERLRNPEQRQRLGWPLWDGHRFWIATPAVDPGKRGAFLTAQPPREPLPELLPASCLRQPGADSPSTVVGGVLGGPLRAAA